MIKNAEIKGLWRFGNVVANFSDGLIGLAGRKGEGKTTFLEALSALPFYGQSVSRAVVGRNPSVKQLLDKGGFISIDFDWGGEPAEIYRDRKITRVRIGGREAIDDKGLALLLPGLDWFLAGPMAAQNKSGAFDRLVRKERQTIWHGLLTPVLEPLHQLHERAHEREREAEKALADAEALGRAMLAKLERYQLEREQLPMLDARVATLSEDLASARAEQTLADEQWQTVEQSAVVWNRRRELQRTRAKISATDPNAVVNLDNGELEPGEPPLAYTDDEFAALQQRLETERQRLMELKEQHARYDNLREIRRRDKTALDDAEAANTTLSSVPCGGQGIYGRCPLIVGAVERAEQLPAMLKHLDELDEALVFDAPAPLDYSRFDRLKADLEAAATARQRRRNWERANAELARIDSELASLGIPEHTEQHIEHARKVRAEATARVNRASERLREATDAAAECRGIVATYQEIEQTSADLAPLQEDLSDWRTIAEAFSPRGIPQLEIAAYGPGLCEIANGLLAEATGGRWSVQLETERESSTGSTVQDMSLVVVDSQRGERRRVETYSPGELSIVDTAFRMAMVISRLELGETPEFRCLWFDEPTANLGDPDLDEWIALARAALATGEIRQIFVVSHQDRLIDACDAVFRFADGIVSRGSL